ncbi:hypothetical protein ANO11243_073850 [Dothideomycetidae sp. 11243]|nr:hypothetical protein ANO11243_073850 [fungal sp. No.11243]
MAPKGRKQLRTPDAPLVVTLLPSESHSSKAPGLILHALRQAYETFSSTFTRLWPSQQLIMARRKPAVGARAKLASKTARTRSGGKSPVQVEDAEAAAYLNAAIRPKESSPVPSESIDDNIMVATDPAEDIDEPGPSRRTNTVPAESQRTTTKSSKKRLRTEISSAAGEDADDRGTKKARTTATKQSGSGRLRRPAAAIQKSNPHKSNAKTSNGTSAVTVEVAKTSRSDDAAPALASEPAKRGREPRDKAGKVSESHAPESTKAVEGSSKGPGRPRKRARMNGHRESTLEASMQDADHPNRAEREDAGHKAAGPSQTQRETSVEDAEEMEYQFDRRCWYHQAVGLHEAEKLADEHLDGVAEPRTATCRSFIKQSKRLHELLTLQSEDLTDLDRGCQDALKKVVNAAKQWRDTTKELSNSEKAREVVDDIYGVAVPELSRTLVRMLSAFGPITALSPAQLEYACDLLRGTVQLCGHAKMLCENHKIKPKLKREQSRINARIHAAFDAFIIPLRRARDTSYRVLQARRLTARVVRETFEAQDVERQKHWARLHEVRIEAEIPTGSSYLSPKQMDHLRMVSMSSVAPAAEASAAKRKTWYTRRTAAAREQERDANGVPMTRVQVFGHRRGLAPNPDDENGEPWGGIYWDLEEDQALMHALEQFVGNAKIWEGVIWKTCRATLDPRTRKYTPGPLGRFNVAEIVEKGVWIAREVFRTDWLRGRDVQRWTLVKDPRLLEDEGLEKVAPRVFSVYDDGEGDEFEEPEEEGPEAEVEEQEEPDSDASLPSLGDRKTKAVGAKGTSERVSVGKQRASRGSAGSGRKSLPIEIAETGNDDDEVDEDEDEDEDVEVEEEV